LYINVEHQIGILSPGLVQDIGVSTIIIAKNLGVFEELPPRNPDFELRAADEMVSVSIHLLAARRSGSVRH
jgi:hypothetical protein